MDIGMAPRQGSYWLIECPGFSISLRLNIYLSGYFKDSSNLITLVGFCLWLSAPFSSCEDAQEVRLDYACDNEADEWSEEDAKHHRLGSSAVRLGDARQQDMALSRSLHALYTVSYAGLMTIIRQHKIVVYVYYKEERA